MERASIHPRNAGIAVCSAALATALLGGFVSQPAFARDGTEAVSSDAYAAQTSEEIQKAEKRVARSPNSASRRADLAHAYLSAGRFESAAAAFRDAQSLGDKDARTALGLALANIGSGRNAEALRVLTQWQEKIPASDLGLAIALAGQPAQGVAILTDVVRGGDNTAMTRQNLAYAYALGGQWSQARVIASQDIPGDQLDARMTAWARAATSADSRTRVASLLGTPRNAYDPGMPEQLALGGDDGAERMAQADPLPLPVAPTPNAPMDVADANGELPALAQRKPMHVATVPEPVAHQPEVDRLTPVQTLATKAAEEPSVPAAQPVKAQALVQVAKAETVRSIRFVSRPVVQRLPEVRMSRAKMAAASPVRSHREPSAKAPAAHLAKASSVSPDGTHLVQLGSFRTMEGAQRAWGIFVSRDPRLKDHTMRITEAMVAGRKYFRVAAEGFDRGAAHSMCSTVKSRGNDCLAYAETREIPGALPLRERGSAPLLAR